MRSLSGFSEARLRQAREEKVAQAAALRMRADRLDAEVAEINRDLERGRPNVVSEFILDAELKLERVRHAVMVTTEPTKIWDRGIGQLITRNLPTSDDASRSKLSAGIIAAIREAAELPPAAAETLTWIEEMRGRYNIKHGDR
jgi:hypothetical protein